LRSGKKLTKKNKTIILLILLWGTLAGLFLIWGVNAFITLINIPNWPAEFAEYPLAMDQFDKIVPILYLGYLTSACIGLVFSFVFVIVAYGIYKKDQWVWPTGLIFSTIFLTIFGFLLASFMINAVIFKDEFSIIGLIIVIIAFLTDLGVIFLHTRPATKLYFEDKE
jgi:hypothetical protein